MTYEELLQAVYTLTTRPDLEEQTVAAIHAATLKMHMTDFYSKDLYETVVPFNEPSYIISFDYASFIKNFRAVRYIRKLNADNTPGDFITIVQPEELFDGYNRAKSDIAYMAGRHIEIKSSTALSKFIFGCYVLPVASRDNYSSWIAELYPFAIVYEAARVIFKTTGYDEQSAQYNNFVAEQVQLLKISNVPETGF